MFGSLMPTVIISATAHNVGKTAIAAALTTYFNERNLMAIATQAWSKKENRDVDPFTTLLKDSSRPTQGDASTPASKIAEFLSVVLESESIAVVEGEAGDHIKNLELAEATDGLIILVGNFGEDMIKQSAPYGTRLLGIIVNSVPRYRQHELEAIVLPTLQQSNVPFLGWIPETRRLLAPTAIEVSNHLQAEIICNPQSTDRLIDNFLIGGMILDWGPTYFNSQENVGVIVRGDRPDIQLAALQSDSVKAMILTGGAQPVEYVIYEAGKRNIPIALTSLDTTSVAEQLGTLPFRNTFNHSGKLDCMLELIKKSIDLDTIENALTQPVTR